MVEMLCHSVATQLEGGDRMGAGGEAQRGRKVVSPTRETCVEGVREGGETWGAHSRYPSVSDSSWLELLSALADPMLTDFDILAIWDVGWACCVVVLVMVLAIYK
ncbi:hypothetical protein Dimus_014808 [Dionaea muscipula]